MFSEPLSSIIRKNRATLDQMLIPGKFISQASREQILIAFAFIFIGVLYDVLTLVCLVIRQLNPAFSISLLYPRSGNFDLGN